MRNTLFGLLSVVVLAAALTVGLVSTPVAEAQFASNNRSIKLRETASGNVTAPAAGYASVFKDSTDTTGGAFFVKDTSGNVYGILGEVPITAAAADATLTIASAGEVIVYDGAASQTLTLPTIGTADGTIGLHYVFYNVDSDSVAVVCASADQFLLVAGTADGDDSITLATGDMMEVTAVSATTWACILHQ